ncbi:MAG TPA: AAA family ATPase [Candidatus Obscuribacterales bacterium]
MPNTWIFQINPGELDLNLHLQRIAAGLAEAEGEWPVQRHARQMRAGDRLLCWQSGSDGGLMASGELLSEAYRQPEEGPWYVGFRLQARIEPRLTRAELKAESRLRELSLLKRSQGREFAVTPVQARCLERLLAPRSQVLVTGPAVHSLPLLIQRIRRQGLLLSDSLIRRYHLALQTSTLVILAGGSGLGKSWLTRAYAGAVGAHYLLAPVAPNWLSPEDLLGYMHPLKASFQPTEVTRFIQAAASHWQHARRQGLSAEPFHLVLDEINLARIEYYFAPLLSLLEVRRRGEPAKLTLADGSELLLPANLSCIGTLNMDETTQPLSDKVCDRAQIIELELDQQKVLELLAGQPWSQLLQELWPALQALVPFVYRSLSEVQSYLALAQSQGVDWLTAFDEQLVQKILPRLRQGRGHDLALLQQLQDALPEACVLSLRKLAALQAQLQEQGFAAFF